MSTNKPIVTYEFGTLYIEGQAHKEGDTPLRKTTFDNLWDFILSNRASDDTDVVMSVHTRGGRRYIKTGRYVGTVQTKDGQIIEILPKIYKASGQQEKDKDICRKVILNMNSIDLENNLMNSSYLVYYLKKMLMNRLH